MADKTRQSVIMTCSIVACIVTLITCGTLIGGMNSRVGQLEEASEKTMDKQDRLLSDMSIIKESMAFDKGVVTTQLTTQGNAIVRIEKKLDDLMRTPDGQN